MLLSPFYREGTKAEEIKWLPLGHSRACGTAKIYLSSGPDFSGLVNNLHMKKLNDTCLGPDSAEAHSWQFVWFTPI